MREFEFWRPKSRETPRDITKRWLRISTITVKDTEKESRLYLLSNRTEGEDARANYLRDSARKNITGEVA